LILFGYSWIFDSFCCHEFVLTKWAQDLPLQQHEEADELKRVNELSGHPRKTEGKTMEIIEMISIDFLKFPRNHPSKNSRRLPVAKEMF